MICGLAANFFFEELIFFVAFFSPEDFAAAAFATVLFTAPVPFCLAHLARCAAAMRSLPAALMVLLFVAKSSGLKLVALFFEP